MRGRTCGSRATSTSSAAHASTAHARPGSSDPSRTRSTDRRPGSPEARHAIHAPGSAKTAAAPNASGSCRASHAIFGPTCPGSRLQPVKRAQPRPRRRPAPAHVARAPIAPDQRRPQRHAVGSHATSPSSCDPNEARRSPRPAHTARSSLSTRTRASDHSSHSCSAHPGRGYDSECAQRVVATRSRPARAPARRCLASRRRRRRPTARSFAASPGPTEHRERERIGEVVLARPSTGMPSDVRSTWSIVNSSVPAARPAGARRRRPRSTASGARRHGAPPARAPRAP